jgi:hypothetical protein
MLGGKWTYRSYLNQTALISVDADAALAQIFEEGIFDLSEAEGRVDGAFGMDSGNALAITGHARPGTDRHAASFSLIGNGLSGTDTARWRYEYRGIVCPRWPENMDQSPCIVGTVLCVKDHGAAGPAGIAATFIAVRHSDNPPPRTTRRFALLT